MRTLVLGGGFGGIVTAHALRNELAAEHEVTLVSRDSDFYLGVASHPAEEAQFMKTAFGEHFVSTGGNVRYVM
ncbi:MAG: NAD(P)-binding protein [Acidimicrobiales bacterium]